MQHHRTIERLRSEFLEMPGLRLTAEQVHRFCGVELGACASALETLVNEQFLIVRDGRYSRVGDGTPRPRPAKADVRGEQARRSA
jgi:hypothetical protein